MGEWSFPLRWEAVGHAEVLPRKKSGYIFPNYQNYCNSQNNLKQLVICWRDNSTFSCKIRTSQDCGICLFLPALARSGNRQYWWWMSSVFQPGLSFATLYVWQQEISTNFQSVKQKSYFKTTYGEKSTTSCNSERRQFFSVSLYEGTGGFKISNQEGLWVFCKRYEDPEPSEALPKICETVSKWDQRAGCTGGELSLLHSDTFVVVFCVLTWG